NSRDITDRREAEESLRESEKQYRLMFDSNPNPMWIFDRETLAFLAVNDAAIRHYGYSCEEFLALTIKDICPAEDVAGVLEVLQREAKGTQEIWRHRKKDGSPLQVEVKWSPIS